MEKPVRNPAEITALVKNIRDGIPSTAAADFTFDPEQFRTTYAELYATHQRLTVQIERSKSLVNSFGMTKIPGDMLEVQCAWDKVIAQSKTSLETMRLLDQQVCAYLNSMEQTYRSYLASDDQARVDFTQIDTRQK
ncbi:hypothetical protein KEM60_00441 [Austwickia sp. TVS 96-490-7B]|uniref:hypothetical protein n=1 Tax=Austwickia sp. TVS 96-490-7B TaxID=2830843 RepID=UPI001C5823AB|nr:hypothetical protein [Austwickia sp. TVS 96-490-7B]MBW3084254.1 hypothetical protein [Austwickia sp. TVS 96-490-7B]